MAMMCLRFIPAHEPYLLLWGDIHARGIKRDRIGRMRTPPVRLRYIRSIATIRGRVDTPVGHFEHVPLALFLGLDYPAHAASMQRFC